MINLEWVAHRSGVHRMFPSSADIKDGDGNALVTTYAVHRPDGNWSLMLINRDPSKEHRVRVAFESSNRTGSFVEPVTSVNFGAEQYAWKDDGPNSHADPDGPPAGRTVPGGAQATYTLPKSSITVLRGHAEINTTKTLNVHTPKERSGERRLKMDRQVEAWRHL
jgi:hypothetical protein